MELSPDLTRYVTWAGVVAVGAVLAVLDWRWTRRPVFGVLLLAGVFGGLITTEVSPFSFGGGSYYMQGVLISAGSALALVGYVFAMVLQFARQRLGRQGRQ